MRLRTHAQLLALRATEEALDRYPERTVAAVRDRLERSTRRDEGEPLDSRAIAAQVTVRLIDVHPAVGERVVRVWLRHARRKTLDQVDPRRG
jgi:hypothetical protein